MYDYKALEEKWNRIWNNNKTFKMLRDRLKPPFFAMCGYNSPSIDSYIKMDAYARYMRLRGYNVLFPAIKDLEIYRKNGIGMDYTKCISDTFMYKSKIQILNYLVENNVVEAIKMDNVVTYRADIKEFYDIIDKMILPDSTDSVRKEFFKLEEGYNLYFQTKKNDAIIRVFSSEIEKLFLSTFVILPYNSEMAKNVMEDDEYQDYLDYIENPIEDELIFSGNYIYNPVTEQNMPIFIGVIDNPYIAAPSLDELAMKYASKYDLDVMSIDYFDDFSLHLRKQAYNILDPLNILEPATLNNAFYMDIAVKEKDEYTFFDCFNGIGFILAPIASIIDLDINVIDYKDEINKWLPLDIYLFQDAKELINSLFIHHLLHKVDFIHNNIFAKKIIYQNPKIIHNYDNVDANRLMVFANVNEDVANSILNSIWMFYRRNLSNKFIELDASYNQLKKDVKQAYDARDYNMVMAYLTRFMTLSNEKKGISDEQALGVLKMLSPITPYIAEEIYQTVFNNLDTIAYEVWPL